jgi:trimeric autotransporter adhesin
MLKPQDVNAILSTVESLDLSNPLVQKDLVTKVTALGASSNLFQNVITYSAATGGPAYLGEGNHIVMTGAGDDQIYLGSGNDLVNAGGGNNMLYLGEGINVGFSGVGDDVIYGGSAADLIKAGDGNNTIYAAGGDNFVVTGMGNDTIYVSEGQNFISTGAGDDTVYLGSGKAEFALTKGAGSTTIIGFGSDDSIYFADGTTPDDLSFTIRNGDTLVSAGDDLLATLKWTQLNSVSTVNTPVGFDTNIPIGLDNIPISVEIQGIEDNVDPLPTLDYTSIAKMLWNSGEISNAQNLAGILQNKGATAIEIAQAFNYGLDFRLEAIASALDKGTTFNYTDITVGLWNNGKTLNPRDLARVLQDEGATAVAIAQAFNYGLDFSLETIANALDDGATFNYTDITAGLWSSGKTDFGLYDLAKVLQNEGATAIETAQAFRDGLDFSSIEIARSFNYGLNLSLEAIANALDEGTDFSYTDIAVGLWNSGKTDFGSYDLARVLKNEGATTIEIAQAFNYGLDFSLETIANVLDEGTDFNYTGIAVGLWNSGKTDFNSRDLARVLQNEGATAIEIAQAFTYGLEFSRESIADALDEGTSFDYTAITAGLWESSFFEIAPRELADLLWDEGATEIDISRAFQDIGLSVETLADALDDGVTRLSGRQLTKLNYSSVAKGIWNGGYGIDSRKLADLLWDEGATQAEIGQALHYGIGLNLEQIAAAMKGGVTQSDGSRLNYIDVAVGLWNSGYGPDARKLAGLLWDEGASQAEVGQSLKYVGISLQGIADAMDDGPIDFNVIDVTKALWDSGYKRDFRELVGLLWNEGISQGDIGQAIRSVGGSLATIADAMDDGPIDFNVIDVTKALWDSGYKRDFRELTGLLWNEEISQKDIGQAIRSVGGSLATIADAMVNGPINFKFIDAAIAMWNSGIPTDSREMADILWDKRASQKQIGQALRSIGISKEGIADAMDDGATGFNYTDVALAVWNSGYGMSSYRLGVILRDEGASFNQAVGALQSVADLDYLSASYEVITGDFKDVIAAIKQEARDAGKSLEATYDDIKEGVKEYGPVILDALKRVPLVGTGVAALEAAYYASQGKEKEALISSIQSALAFYGASNIITPRMVQFAVDVFWELKDGDYQGAASEALNDLGLKKEVADVFVAVAWAMEKGSWEGAIKDALSEVRLSNAKELVTLAWNVINENYQDLIKVGFDLVGLEALGINQSQANAFTNIVVAIRDENPNQVADQLITLAGANAPQVRDSIWIKDLRDGNPANDRQAIQAGLLELGFKNPTQWVNTIWAVKDGRYVDALSEVLVLGQFKDAQNWVKIINDLKKEKYLDALDTAFSLTDFPDGKTLAKAAVAVKNGNFIDAFYDGFDLIEGGRDLKEAFRALRDFNLQEFISSMIKAGPLLIKLAARR